MPSELIPSLSINQCLCQRGAQCINFNQSINQCLEQIIHCRLRLEMSDLSFDLFNRHLTDNHPLWPSVRNCRTLFFCPNYHHIRIDTIMQIEDNYSDIQTLLFGNQSIGTNQNELIFKNVQKFIRRTTQTPTNIYKVSVVMKMKLTSMLPLLRMKLVRTPPPPHMHTHAYVRTRVCVYAHTQTGTRTGTNRLFQVTECRNSSGVV